MPDRKAYIPPLSSSSVLLLCPPLVNVPTAQLNLCMLQSSQVMNDYSHLLLTTCFSLAVEGAQRIFGVEFELIQALSWDNEAGVKVRGAHSFERCEDVQTFYFICHFSFVLVLKDGDPCACAS